MKVNIEGTTYWVKWEHHINTNVVPYFKSSVIPTDSYTFCTIETEGFVEASRGDAKCVSKDPYVKEKGRKISLKRALDKLFPDNKQARTIFWKSYFNRK